MLRGTALAALIAASMATGAACGSESGGSQDEPTQAELAAEKAEQLDVSIDEPFDGETTTRHRMMVSGTVEPPDAEVKVNGISASVGPDGSWEERVDLDLGENPVSVRATVPGSTEQVNDSIDIRRKRTAAQRRAYREAQERKRAERLANLRANAQPIDPELLQKDPDRYAGDVVVMTGEIFQIQEGGDNFFLMDTECSTEFDVTLCDGPTVHVAYDFPTDKTEEDLVTIYGTVIGGMEYDTAAGGSNYVASIEGEIIE